MSYKDKFTTLTVAVPREYKKAIIEVAEKEGVSVSEVFRRIHSLNADEFRFVFTKKDSELLTYAQTMFILLYGFIDYLKGQRKIYAKRNPTKEAFYSFVEKQVTTQYNYYSERLLPVLEEGFNEAYDGIVEKEAEKIEHLAYLIEKGDDSDWTVIKKIAKKYMKDK